MGYYEYEDISNSDDHERGIYDKSILEEYLKKE
jgi:hypothetical protein